MSHDTPKDSGYQQLSYLYLTKGPLWDFFTWFGCLLNNTSVQMPKTSKAETAREKSSLNWLNNCMYWYCMLYRPGVWADCKMLDKAEGFGALNPCWKNMVELTSTHSINSGAKLLARHSELHKVKDARHGWGHSPRNSTMPRCAAFRLSGASQNQSVLPARLTDSIVSVIFPAYLCFYHEK